MAQDVVVIKHGFRPDDHELHKLSLQLHSAKFRLADDGEVHVEKDQTRQHSLVYTYRWGMHVTMKAINLHIYSNQYIKFDRATNPATILH